MLTKQMYATLFLTFMLVISETAVANTVLQANGFGVVSAPPNQAVVSVDVSLTDINPTKAQHYVSERIDVVLAGLSAFSIVEDSLDSGYVMLSPDYEWDREASRQRLLGFRATRSVSFTLNNLNQVAPLMTALTDAKVTRISPLAFINSEADEAKDRALALAVENATHKLQLLAKAAEMSLSSIATINESFSSLPSPSSGLMRAEIAPDRASKDNYVFGDITYRAEVIATGIAK